MGPICPTQPSTVQHRIRARKQLSLDRLMLLNQLIIIVTNVKGGALLACVEGDVLLAIVEGGVMLSNTV